MADIDSLYERYSALYTRQNFDAAKLDYSIADENIKLLNKLAQVGNSSISVFDMYRQKHIYTSHNFQSVFGYDLEELAKDDLAYFNSKIHPDDLLMLRTSGMEMLDFIFSVPVDTRLDYKLINDYRMLDGNDNYIRVIEQHQVMELDADGNVWLSLSILDLSPDQDVNDREIKSQLFNFRQGRVVALNNYPDAADPGLTKKETEVLTLVKDGLLSKEISHKLCISVHTVNTHRQRILEKLDANNSMEAVKKASALGLLG
jgi:DNA-binding CsgD family transcriptional regulator